MTVGFEREVYLVNESAGFQEVCVIITSPRVDQPLGRTVPLTYVTVTGSAGNIH